MQNVTVAYNSPEPAVMIVEMSAAKFDALVQFCYHAGIDHLVDVVDCEKQGEMLDLMDALAQFYVVGKVN